MTDSPKLPAVNLPDEQEEWTATLRLKKLRDRGWRGTVLEYSAALRRLRFKDPIALGQLSPTAEDCAAARALEESDADLGAISSDAKQSG